MFLKLENGVMFEFEKMKLTSDNDEIIIHRAQSRGYFNHGWLKTWHTFSFANYFDPERVCFGMLRVINDDSIAAGMGFGLHPHQDMEIITIPLKGSLKHTDNTGNEEIITPGQVQVMTAGKGIWHSEFNASKTDELCLLQIWIFPEKECLDPGYKTGDFHLGLLSNQLICVAGDINTSGSHLPIHQQAFVSVGHLNQGNQLEVIKRMNKNGVYLFIIEGEIELDNQHLKSRDGIGLLKRDTILLKSTVESRFVIFEVPL